jgi:hypothetical protein
MFSFKQEKEFPPIYLTRGDSLNISYTDDTGKTDLILSQSIEDDMIINQAKIFAFKDEFGMKEGYCCIIGNKGD